VADSGANRHRRPGRFSERAATAEVTDPCYRLNNLSPPVVKPANCKVGFPLIEAVLIRNRPPALFAGARPSVKAAKSSLNQRLTVTPSEGLGPL
jgi:hypothetical protein